MLFSFTGPSTLTAEQESWCIQDLLNFSPSKRRSGGAFGLDTIVAEQTHPDDLTLVLPMGMRFNGMLLHLGASETIWVPGGYRRRNEALVAGTDMLFAYLKSGEFYRSGEWMTVNIAKRLGVPVEFRLIPLTPSDELLA